MKKRLLPCAGQWLHPDPEFGQAQTLEESVAQTLATHPKIKEAFDLYQARLYQHDGAKGILSHDRSAWWRRL